MAWERIRSCSFSISSRLLTTFQTPLADRFLHLLQQPNIPYPGIPDEYNLFSETSLGLAVRTVFLDIQEHHKICECPRGSPNVSESHPYVAPTFAFTPGNAGVATSPPTSFPIVPQSGRCGIVPVPAPLVFQSTANAGQNEGEQEVDGNHGTDAIALSLPTPRINVIDYSMSNAWFPGHLGGVSFTKLQTAITGNGKRDRIVCAVDFQAPDIRSVWNRPEESECLALGGRRSQQDGQGKMNAYVYETYDPEKKSMHRGLGDSSISGAGTNAFTSTSTSSSNDYPEDPHKCPRCLEREALIRLERKKAEHLSKMMLDRGLRSYGSGGYNWDHQDDECDDNEDMDETGDDEEDEEEDEDEEMRDFDVDELGIDVDGIVAQITQTRSTGSASSIQTDDDYMSSIQFVSFGDDDREQYVRTDDRKRRRYDKCRIGVECRGVADVLLSGKVGIFFGFDATLF